MIRGQTTWSFRSIHVSIRDVRDFYNIKYCTISYKKREEKENSLSLSFSLFVYRENKKKRKKKKKRSYGTYAARPTRPCSSPCYQLCVLRRNLRSWSAAFAYKFADTPADIHSFWLSGSLRSSVWDAATTPRPETTRCRTRRTPRACRTRICIVPEMTMKRWMLWNCNITITHAGETMPRGTQYVCI